MYNKYANLEFRPFTLLEYLVAFFLIITMNTVYTSVGSKLHLNLLGTMLFVLLLFCSLYIMAKKNMDIRKTFATIIVYFLFVLGYLFFNSVTRQNFHQFFPYFIICFPSFLIYFSLKQKQKHPFDILFYFSNIVFYLALLSLLFWMLFVNMHIGSSSQLYLPWAHQSISNYHWIQFSYQNITLLGKDFVRNTGIFTEGPMFTYVLLVAFLTELFFRANRRRLHLIVLLVTMVTTFSTTGIVLTLLAFFFSYFLNKSHFRLGQLIRIFSIPIIILGVGLALYFILVNKATTNSYSVRANDILAGFIAWKDHPIIGNGYRNIGALSQYFDAWRIQAGGAALGYSSGLLNVLSDGGVYLTLFYLYPFIHCLLKLKNKAYFELGIFNFLLLVILFITVVPYVPLTLAILAFEYSFLVEANNMGAL